MLNMSDLAKEFVEFFDCEYEYFPNNTYEEIMEKLMMLIIKWDLKYL